MPQFLALPGDLDPASGEAVLRGEEARHLLHALRARTGDPVCVFDGAGRRWQGRLADAGRGEARIEALASLPANESRLAVELIQALPKGDRWEWILEKGTELGATCFHPVLTARTVVRVPGARAGNKLERWRKIAFAAVKQCERARVPKVAAPLSLRDCLAGLGPARAGQLRLALTERSSGPGALVPGTPANWVPSVLLAAGPEGGWSEEDRQLLAGVGFRPWGLGARILRSETAVVAALAVLQARWGDLEPPDQP